MWTNGRGFLPMKRCRPEPGYEAREWWVPAAPFVPHPDTEPAAVRASLDAAVRAARTRLGPAATPEQISAEAVVPVWCVRRYLEGAEPPARARKPVIGRPPGRNGETAAAVRDYMAGKGRATANEIVAGSGRCEAAVRAALRRRSDMFRVGASVPTKGVKGSVRHYWELVDRKGGAA